MMDHIEIAALRRKQEHARRERVREVMADYDEAHDAILQKLHDACARIGHHWQPLIFKTAGDTVVCHVCGAEKIL